MSRPLPVFSPSSTQVIGSLMLLFILTLLSSLLSFSSSSATVRPSHASRTPPHDRPSQRAHDGSYPSWFADRPLSYSKTLSDDTLGRNGTGFLKEFGWKEGGPAAAADGTAGRRGSTAAGASSKVESGSVAGSVSSAGAAAHLSCAFAQFAYQRWSERQLEPVADDRGCALLKEVKVFDRYPLARGCSKQVYRASLRGLPCTVQMVDSPVYAALDTLILHSAQPSDVVPRLYGTCLDIPGRDIHESFMVGEQLVPLDSLLPNVHHGRIGSDIHWVDRLQLVAAAVRSLTLFDSFPIVGGLGPMGADFNGQDAVNAREDLLARAHQLKVVGRAPVIYGDMSPSQFGITRDLRVVVADVVSHRLLPYGYGPLGKPGAKRSDPNLPNVTLSSEPTELAPDGSSSLLGDSIPCLSGDHCIKAFVTHGFPRPFPNISRHIHLDKRDEVNTRLNYEWKHISHAHRYRDFACVRDPSSSPDEPGHCRGLGRKTQLLILCHSMFSYLLVDNATDRGVVYPAWLTQEVTQWMDNTCALNPDKRYTLEQAIHHMEALRDRVISEVDTACSTGSTSDVTGVTTAWLRESTKVDEWFSMHDPRTEESDGAWKECNVLDENGNWMKANVSGSFLPIE